MHLYLRMLQKKGKASYTAEERQRIHELLIEAPGVVKLIERHHKGGYAVTLDVSSESLDDLIEYIPAHGYQSVFLKVTPPNKALQSPPKNGAAEL